MNPRLRRVKDRAEQTDRYGYRWPVCANSDEYGECELVPRSLEYIAALEGYVRGLEFKLAESQQVWPGHPWESVRCFDCGHSHNWRSVKRECRAAGCPCVEFIPNPFGM